jgi:hypothetical protein
VIARFSTVAATVQWRRSIPAACAAMGNLNGTMEAGLNLERSVEASRTRSVNTWAVARTSIRAGQASRSTGEDAAVDGS